MKTFSVTVTVLFVLRGDTCAAASAAASAMTAITADESTSVGRGAFCLLFSGGSGARAVSPSDTGYASELYAADVLSITNLTGGAAAPSCGSPGAPLDGYLYSDLLRGSGGEKKIGRRSASETWGCALAQHFPSPDIPIRCGQCTAPLAAAAVPSPAPLVPHLHA
eukprot:SAG31_NODE_284_length_18497_cov_11.811773_19_plen_165_part_00